MRYLSTFFITFITFCLLWITLIYAQIGNLTQKSKWIYEAYQLKELAAKKIKSKKILIVGGSNALFGFNSLKMESNWKRKVINGGMHAGLGMPYILDRSKKILDRGDIVILPLEYSFYKYDGNPTEVYSDFILSRDEVYFRQLPMVEKLMIIARVSFKRLYLGLKNITSEELKPTNGVYGVKNINSHGDQINLEPEFMTNKQYAKLDKITAYEIDDSDLSTNFIEIMDDYINWAKNNGICIIAVPPNHMFFEQYMKEKYQSFHSNIKGYYYSRNVVFIGKPADYMYEKKYYFNTSYHLNSEGIELRSDQISKDIGEHPEAHCESDSYSDVASSENAL